MKFLFSVGAFAHLSVLDTGIQKGAPGLKAFVGHVTSVS